MLFCENKMRKYRLENADDGAQRSARPFCGGRRKMTVAAAGPKPTFAAAMRLQ